MNQSAEPATPTRLLNSAQVANRLSISVRTLWRLLRANKGFPPPVRQSKKNVRWKSNEVEQYIRDLATS